MRPFLILGRPRSRTAWLANFLTWEGTWCYHEASTLLWGQDESLQALLRATGRPYAGTADTGLLLTAHQALQELPGARLVLLDGPTALARFTRWAEAQGDPGPVPLVEAAFQSARTLLQEHGALTVDPEGIPGETAVRAIWGHVTEEPFPEARYRMLRDLNVQVTQGYVDRLLGA